LITPITLIMFGHKYDIDARNCSDSITSRYTTK
jgi:hypothetical protein